VSAHGASYRLGKSTTPIRYLISDDKAVDCRGAVHLGEVTGTSASSERRAEQRVGSKQNVEVEVIGVSVPTSRSVAYNSLRLDDSLRWHPRPEQLWRALLHPANMLPATSWSTCARLPYQRVTDRQAGAGVGCRRRDRDFAGQT
jgi:hypothetical protein